jgi:probable F420-dependent oxidoreductase
MKLGKIGVWAMLETMASPDMVAYARHIERAGYAALWIAEGGRNAMVTSSWLLAHTTNLVVATGIANIYARDPMAMVGAREALNEQSGGRFVLGIGVSHEPVVRQARGHVYGKPVPTMRAYLEAMARVEYLAPPPPERSLTVVAALGPQMLALSRDLADGAHPYNAPPEHTERARAILGPGKLLAVEQKVLLETDPITARRAARQGLSFYFGLRNYIEHWRRLGFGDDDFAAGGSDRLIDALVAWGDDTAIRTRIEAHLAAGADHVCIQPLTDASTTLTRLAPALLAGS